MDTNDATDIVKDVFSKRGVRWNEMRTEYIDGMFWHNNIARRVDKPGYYVVAETQTDTPIMSWLAVLFRYEPTEDGTFFRLEVEAWCDEYFPTPASASDSAQSGGGGDS